MKNKNKIKKQNSKLSFSEMAGLYKRIRIPWIPVILVAIMSFALKKVEVLLVPFNSKIMTGAIDEAGFLGGFITMTIIYTLVEAVQGGIGEFASAMTARNTRYSVWDKLLNLPCPFLKRMIRKNLYLV